jgi:hypothetical protein
VPPDIPEYYCGLINRCWDARPHTRPSFARILEEFQATGSWVVEGTDQGALAQYEARLRAAFVPTPSPLASPHPPASVRILSAGGVNKCGEGVFGRIRAVGAVRPDKFYAGGSSAIRRKAGVRAVSRHLRQWLVAGCGIAQGQSQNLMASEAEA